MSINLKRSAAIKSAEAEAMEEPVVHEINENADENDEDKERRMKENEKEIVSKFHNCECHISFKFYRLIPLIIL